MDKQSSAIDFKQVQRQLADHLRDPKHHPPPEGLEARRLDIYRRLFFKNMLGFISRGFPVLKSLYKEDDWNALVRSFYACHHCHSPYFIDIAKEFLLYLEKEHTLRQCDPPYLYELAHYEHVELVVSIAEDAGDSFTIDAKGDLMEGRPALSPLAQWHGYQWPVHRISPDYKPAERDSKIYWIAVCRDAGNKVRYMLLNAITALLLDYLSEHPNSSGRDAIVAVAKQHCPDNIEAALENAPRLFQDLYRKSIVLGVKI